MRASAVFALGTLLDVGSVTFKDGHGGEEDCDDDEKVKAELNIVRSLLQFTSDGSPLVRAEICAGMQVDSHISDCLILFLCNSYL